MSGIGIQNLELLLSSLRDAVRGTDSKTISDLVTLLTAIRDTAGIKKIADTVSVLLAQNSIPDTQPVPNKVVNSTIAVPTDKQAVYRTQAFLTTTPLAGNASYTSATFNALLFKRITGKVFANQDGTLNLQHSDDGSTWDTLTSISVSANTPAKFDEPIYCQYVRVNYTNDATSQTTFRLSGYLSAD
jgi:hypothetical protein